MKIKYKNIKKKTVIIIITCKWFKYRN